MAEPILKVDRNGDIVRLTLNRPDKLNSLTVELAAELVTALEAIMSDRNIRCIVLSGAGRAFCAGQDLNERRPVIEGERIDLGDALTAGVNRIVRLIRALPQPVIAAVRGAAAGAGANLALACDIVVAGHSAKFIQSFSKLGLIPDGGGTWILPRKVGLARATGMVLLGEPVSGETAADWGLVWRCVTDEALDETAMQVARDLAARSPHANRLSKRALHASAANTLDAQLDLECDLQREAGFTEEYRAAVAKFLGKQG